MFVGILAGRPKARCNLGIVTPHDCLAANHASWLNGKGCEDPLKNDLEQFKGAQLDGSGVVRMRPARTIIGCG
jgi:hypothetical protein